MIIQFSAGQIPALKALIPFIIGIVSYPFIKEWNREFIICLLMCWMSMLVIHFAPWKIRKQLVPKMFAPLTFLLWFLAGLIVCYQTDLRYKNNHVSNLLQNSNYWQGKLKSTPLKTKNGWTAQLEIYGCISNNEVIPASGLVSVWFKNNKRVNELQPGTSILFKNKIEEIVDNSLPGNFSFAQWQAKKQIYHHTFLNEQDWKIIQQTSHNSIQSYLYLIKNQCINTFQKFIPNKHASALAQAMTLGVRSDIDPSLMQAYSSTGIIHLIAISGLHVGLIYMLLNWVIGLFRIRTRFIKLLLILGGIWIFTLLTGAGPSVCRAATMCTFLLVGQSFSKRPQTLNSIAASALVLLIIEPRWIYEIGFQLSYAAVLGIGIFQPVLQKLVYLENRFLRLLWDTTTVTWSAQAFTFPLVLYYFHQFPLVFWASNLIVVPMAALLLYSCIALLIFSWNTSVASFIGFVLSGWLSWINEWIFLLSRLPFAVKKNIFIEPETCWLILILVVLLALWISKPSKWILGFALVVSLIWSSFHSIKFYQAMNRKEIWIFPEENDFSAWLLKQNEAKTVFQPKSISEATSKAFLWLNTKQKSNEISASAEYTWSDGNTRILVINNLFTKGNSYSCNKSTYLIVNKIPEKVQLDWLEQNKDATWIWTPKLPSKQLWKWKKAADSLHLRHHDLKKQGPLQIKLPTNYP